MMDFKHILFLCRTPEKRRILNNISFQKVLKSNSGRYATSLAFEQKSTNKSTSTYVNPLRSPDFFKVNDIFTVKDLYDARVYYGHKLGSLHAKMNPYVYGKRFDHLIIDLEQTAKHLRQALNFTAHIAYRGGIILFVSSYQQHCPVIEKTAMECGEYAHTRTWDQGTFTNSTQAFGCTIRLPDLVIFLNTLNTVMTVHTGVLEAAKMNIPSIGIIDTNCDPTLITYPVPGNDDSIRSVELYLKLFKTAILKGKEVREKELEELPEEQFEGTDE